MSQQTSTRRTLFVHFRGVAWPDGVAERISMGVLRQAAKEVILEFVIELDAELGFHLRFEGEWSEGQKGGFARIALEHLDGIPITYDPPYENATAQEEEQS